MACLASCPITFVSSAQWHWQEGQRIAQRVLPTSNLALYHAGRGVVTVAGVRHRIGPGSLVVIPRGVPHAVVHDRGHPYHASAVHCQAPVFGGPRDLFAALGCPVRLHLDPSRDAAVFAAMGELPRLDARRMPGWEARAAAHLALLVHHLLAAHGSAFARTGTASTDRDAVRLAPALERIEAGLDQHLPMRELAALVGLGAVAFRLLMHRVTGRAPLRYIQDRRLDRACRLLRQSAAPIPVIAAAVGMQDATAFSRLFSARIGMAPGRWRTSADRL